MFKNLSKRERRLLAITLTVVLGALTYRMVVLPRLSKMWQLSARAATAEIDLLEMERNLALGERIESRYKTYEAAIAQKGTDLEESSSFLRTVSDLTQSNEMEVLDWRLPPIELGKYYKIFSVRLTVKTRPVWLARFLSNLEESEQTIRISDVQVTALDDSENLAVNMKLTKVVAAEGNSK